jgi:uncharacterized protein (DUF1684 family)
MRRIGLAVCFAVLATTAFAAPTPQEAFRASLVNDNKDWAEKPHAILKIQDAAYLGEGQSSNLIGIKGKPNSYHWGSGAGLLTASVKNGHPVIVKDGKTYSETEIAKGITIDTDIDIAGAQTQVNAGVLGARFMVYNQKNPDALAFKGVDYYPYNAAYVVTASFKPDHKLPPHAFKTSRGTTKQFFHAGDATFSLQGKTITLPFYAGSNDPKQIGEMSAFFTDDLTGKGAYGAGRYVDIDGFGKYPPATVTIDFNYAYNPNCARSRFFTCPVAIDNIQLAMKAGEKDPHMAH